ncbi:HNH endonuclease [Chryseobacterium sp. JK1]|uniref:HNH endonuclease n=1 Tax=Chryseobacterium sp. JK1 TaxID=874294 RepID=UPI003D68B09F
MIDEGLKIDLYKEQDGKCIYCNKDYPIKDLIFDHIFPRSFSDTSDNYIVLTCYKCNDYKSNKNLLMNLNSSAF